MKRYAYKLLLNPTEQELNDYGSQGWRVKELIGYCSKLLDEKRQKEIHGEKQWKDYIKDHVLTILLEREDSGGDGRL